MIRGYQVPAHVAGETVDGETIVIDLLTGAYHTLEGRSAEVWSQLRTDGETAAVELMADDPQQAVLGALVAAGLVQMDDASTVPGIAAEPASVGLTSYTDMAQLLLADPIHEVDERGWPILRTP